MCVTVWVLRYKNKKNGDRGTIVFTATLRRIGGLGGLMMAPRRSIGCGACIPKLTTPRHRGRLLCLGSSQAKASTLRGRHRRFDGGSVFHTVGLFVRAPLLSLLVMQQKCWYHHLQQVIIQSLFHTTTYTPGTTYIYVVYPVNCTGVCSTHTHPYCN